MGEAVERVTAWVPPLKTVPYKHQMDVLQRSWDKRDWALFLEMGTGKTKVTLDTLALQFRGGLIDRALIVAPKGTYRNWADKEIPQHLPDWCGARVCVWSPEQTKRKTAEIESIMKAGQGLALFVVNVEAFSTDRGKAAAERFLKGGKPAFVVDESTTIKNPKALRTKAVIKLGKLARYRRILTGSPVTKSPLDLFAQCAFLDTRYLGHGSWFTFRNRYAIVVNQKMGQRMIPKITGYQRLDELNKILDRFSSRVLKKDCLDLPEKIYHLREVDLTPEQMRAYEQMRRQAIVTLEGTPIVTAASAISQLLRLHQIACGHLPRDVGDPRPAIELPTKRIDALLEAIEETDGKVIIWAAYTADILRIAEELRKAHGPYSAVTYYGATSDADRSMAVAAFQDEAAKVRFFVGQPRTGGYGLTLTAADTVIYYANSHDLEVRLQSEDRAHRIGQTKPVNYIDLLAPDTVERKIVEALRGKLNISTAVLGDGWKEWLI